MTATRLPLTSQKPYDIAAIRHLNGLQLATVASLDGVGRLSVRVNTPEFALPLAHRALDAAARSPLGNGADVRAIVITQYVTLSVPQCSGPPNSLHGEIWLAPFFCLDAEPG